MKKRLVSLTALLLITAVGLLSSACIKPKHIVISSKRIGDYSCSIYEDSTVDIIYYYGSATRLVIPDTLEGYKVVGFGIKAFNGCNTITEVVLPNTVTELPAKLFNSCASLKSLYIPKAVAKIGINAVYECPLFDTVAYEGTEAEWLEIDMGIRLTDNYLIENASLNISAPPAE